MADTIEKIYQRARGTYGKRCIRAELLDTYEMNVNHKLVSAIMTELGIAGLPRPGKRKPNLLGVETLSDRVNRGFMASRPADIRRSSHDAARCRIRPESHADTVPALDWRNTS